VGGIIKKHEEEKKVQWPHCMNPQTTQAGSKEQEQGKRGKKGEDQEFQNKNLSAQPSDAKSRIEIGACDQGMAASQVSGPPGGGEKAKAIRGRAPPSSTFIEMI